MITKTKKVNDYSDLEQIKQIDEMEGNLQNAIDDLILESDEQSDLVSQHASMIITQLAMAAASLRIKKQQSVLKIL
ncbi:MAG: hypothetical protein ACTSQ0_04115 [Candidatus Heimdallarchaeota archaeon]